jgi:D-serine deaminase-like pyridoxal phosphate-dependent protein
MPREATTLDELPTPALLLDLDVLQRNLAAMAERARRLGVALRPHVKTHKSIEVGRLQQELGATGITVSTLEEARAFADHGFDDLTWAFPVILNRLDEVRELARRVRFAVVVDSPQAVSALEALGQPLPVWLKVDCGYHRAGVDPAGPAAVELAAALAASPRLTFAGLLSHSGQTYHAASREEARAMAEGEGRVMAELAERLRGRGITVPAVSVGSTPAMAAVEALPGVTEVRPGNYAFYDFTQVRLGSCAVADCALTVLASVVSCQPGAGHAVVDAGALALSKDAGPEGEPRTMGRVFADYGAGRLAADLHLTSLSQEHGIVSGPLALGARVRILPNHSCLTAACFDHYAVVRGERVVGRWRIWRGR